MNTIPATALPKSAGQMKFTAQKGDQIALFFCGLLLVAGSWASLWFELSAPLTVLLLCGLIVAPFLFRLLILYTSLLGAIVILGTVFMTGFMGSFVGVYDLVPRIYNLGRWVVPLVALTVGLLQVVLARNVWRALWMPWGVLSPPLLLFLAFAAFSATYSSAPITTMGRVLTFVAVTYGVGAALYHAVPRVIAAERILLSLALLMAVVILPGELYLLAPNSIGWHSSGRFRSTFWNPVTLGHLCVLFLPLYWWLMVRIKTNVLLRLGALGMIGILLLNLFLAGSRGAMLALVVIVPLLVWNFISRRTRWLVLAIAIATLVIAVPWQWAEIVTFFTRGAELTNNYQFYSGRLASWQRAVQLWQQSPFVGYGFGSIGNTDATLLGAEGNRIAGASATAGLRLSSAYLEIFASGGVIGATLFFYLLLRSLRLLLTFTARSANRTSASLAPKKHSAQYSSQGQVQGQVQQLGTLALATFAGGLVLNLTETWLISAGSPFAMYWWLVLFLSTRVSTLVDSAAQATAQEIS